MIREERRRGRASSLRHNMGLPLVAKLARASPPGKEAVIRWLNAVESDPWNEISPVPLAQSCFWDLLDRQNHASKVLVRQTRQGHKLDAPLCAQLLAIIAEIEAGRLVFSRPPFRTFSPATLAAYRLVQPAGAPRQDPLVQRPDYRWWSTCRSCGGRRYAPVTIHGRGYVACWQCTPPSQYASIAAVPSPWSLLPEVVAQWGTSYEPGNAAIPTVGTSSSPASPHPIA